MVTSTLTAGQPAPAFTLPDDQGHLVSLTDFAGRSVILYAYPKADTPGCTTQACDFRDSLESFQRDGFALVGISPDSPAALARFRDKYQLSYPLLSDPEHGVLQAYGAWGEKSSYGRTSVGVIRSTFVIGPDAVLLHVLPNVKATGHVEMLRRILGLDGAATG